MPGVGAPEQSAQHDEDTMVDTMVDTMEDTKMPAVPSGPVSKLQSYVQTTIDKY